ncbi:unnamed protein product [Amoebophrya sp. A25]|nr:unnamed protein product [Amoebophrya sp. A25]|eukprot:GSA25T00024974001.1
MGWRSLKSDFSSIVHDPCLENVFHHHISEHIARNSVVSWVCERNIYRTTVSREEENEDSASIVSSYRTRLSIRTRKNGLHLWSFGLHSSVVVTCNPSVRYFGKSPPLCSIPIPYSPHCR